MDDVREIAGQIESSSEDHMIVGHLPHLGKLTSLLITGQESVPLIQFQQGGVACLEKGERGGWSIVWMLIPEVVF